MTNYPKEIKARAALDPKMGIKSSLSKIKSIVALSYLFYKCNGCNATVLYSREQSGKIKIDAGLLEKIKEFFGVGYLNLENLINSNPLFESQLESLYVGLTLLLQLGKISFQNKTADAAERTGGRRFNKIIAFSSNIVLLDLILSGYKSDDVKEFLFKWLQNAQSDNADITSSVCQFLSLATNKTVFKIRKNPSEEIVFQTEGIYQSILENGNVVISDSKENVGPTRVYNSFVKENLDPWVKFNSIEKYLERNESVDADLSLESLSKIISTSLDISSGLAMVEVAARQTESKPTPPKSTFRPAQRIFFGTPGSGKSHKINELTKDKIVFRTTFHPDYDFASFVGCYKPMKADGEITYDFVPQCFTNAYVYAWQNPEKEVCLIIEEINRGNCAQIFGDIFQLLDRNEEGFSAYPIDANQDLSNYLSEIFDGYNGKLVLPPNFSIYASMNTSDQSLFPMDSAFKRRWDWECVPIDYENTASKSFEITIGDHRYSWIAFLKAVNAKIKKATDSEDKQLGNFFIKQSIKKEDFISKVMFYLWSEVCKEEYNTDNNFFRNGNDENKEFSFNELFSSECDELLKGFFKYLEINPLS
ncbi:MAG: AAA family ATPase [Bacteroidales bacterium]|nr:AAA family ATPase [Bacteroidales bacterium]